MDTSPLKDILKQATSCRQLYINMPHLLQLPDLPPRLTRLTLSTPKLNELPDKITSYALENLDIRSSRIKTLPPDVWKMPQLGNLTLVSSALTSLELPEMSTADNKLLYLQLRCPHLRELPDFSGFNIRRFNVSSSKLENVKGRLPQHDRLTDLYLNAPINQPLELPSGLLRFQLLGFQGSHICDRALPKKLNYLHASDCPALEVLPEFPSGTEFTNLSLHKTPARIPDSIKHCKKLFHISLNQWTGDGQLPEGLATFPRLTSMYIHSSKIDAIPPVVLRCENLRRLQIRDCKIKRLPNDWSYLKKLNYLDLSNNKTRIDNFDFVAQLPSLKSINLDGNTWPARLLVESKTRIPLSGGGGIPGVRMKRKTFLPFTGALAKSRLSKEDKLAFLERFRGYINFDKLPEQPLDWLIKGLGVNYAPFRKVLDKQLINKVAADNGKASMNKDMVLFITGKVGMKRTDIREKFEAIGGTLASKFSDKVTHLLIGGNPKYDEAFAKVKPLIINEHVLQDYLTEKQPQFLENEEAKADPQLSESVAVLLRSEDETTLLVGLEMLKNGGVPDNLLGELLVLCKTHNSPKIREITRKLLRRYGDPAWRALLSHRTVIKFRGNYPREIQIDLRLRKMAKSVGEPAAVALSKAMQARYGRGGSYAKRVDKVT